MFNLFNKKIPNYILFWIYKRKNKLPIEYQEVEYIESTGTQYIDTEITLLNSENWKIQCDIMYSEYTESRQLNGSVSAGYYFGINTNGYYEMGTGSYISNVLASLDKFDNIILSNNKENSVKTLNVNNVDIMTRTSSGNSSYNSYIFATSGNSKNYSKMKLKKYILIIDDVTSLELIPCYKKSDNTIGLYDIVNNKFYINKGTGNFIKGNDK